ncbi:MAG: ABC transporter ATP-binding protein [Clostridia bacterium]|nr:ABC transporter ATP-binding protein [Clostridia bacterium]
MKKVIIQALKGYKWKIVLQLTLIAINIYLLTIPARIIGEIVDNLYNMEANKQAILTNTYYLIGICIVLLLVRLGWKYLEVYISRGFEKDIKAKLFERFLKLKVKEIQNIKNGEIMSYFVKDTNEIRSAVYRIFSHGSRIVFTFIIAIFQMAQGVNIYLTLATLCPILLATFLIIKIKKYVEISFKKAQDKFTQMSEYIQESTDSIRTTKAYSCEGSQLKTFILKNRQVRQCDNTVDIYSNLLTTCIDICFGLCYAIAFIYGSKLVLDGIITVGELIAFNGYIALFVGPVSWLPTLIARFKRAQISYQRLDKVFALEREKITVRKINIKEKLEGKIEIKNLNFHYPDMIDKALDNINIEIKKGETLGIIGTIGSGKTTLMNLLTRLYSIPNGKIKIDGRDINEIDIETLRENICYITQDNFLFSSTLKDNISLFKDEYKEDEIKESTQKAVIYEEIKQMPEGIKTQIGERGGDLSGGQKQRVVISRAFLKNSSIIIFDDTFSALDNRTAGELLENIKELTKDKTCIIISNKISDVKQSDKIIVLNNGSIVERGNHTELIEKQGTYYEFYKQQATKAESTLLS